jgi:hypothetical protein
MLEFIGKNRPEWRRMQSPDEGARHGCSRQGKTHRFPHFFVESLLQTIARGVGKAVVNSPLFKCAVAGNDPNVGRLASSIGA